MTTNPLWCRVSVSAAQGRPSIFWRRGFIGYGWIWAASQPMRAVLRAGFHCSRPPYGGLDHPMARNQKRHGIVADGGTHSPRSAWRFDVFGDVAVRGQLSGEFLSKVSHTWIWKSVPRRCSLICCNWLQSRVNMCNTFCCIKSSHCAGKRR